MTDKNILQEASTLLEQYNEEHASDEKSKSKGRRSSRSYAFSLSTYIKPEHVLDFLRGAHWINHWSMCYHDKDVWTKKDNQNDPTHIEGEPKEPHTHIVLYTFNGKSSSSVKKLFDRYSIEIYGADKKQNTFCEECTSVAAQYRYQLHLDDPDRFPYPLEVRKTDNQDYWTKFELTDGLNAPDNKALAMIDDILRGVPYRTMTLQYGKDFVYHYNHIYNMAMRINRQEQGVRQFDEEYIRAYLRTAPFSTADINKFWEIILHIKLCIGYDYKIGNELKITIDEVLK